MAIEILDLSVRNPIFHPLWGWKLGQDRIKEGKKHLNEILLTVKDKNRTEHKISNQKYIDLICEYFKSRAKDHKDDNKNEIITNQTQARWFKTALVAVLGNVDKDSNVGTGPGGEYMQLLEEGRFQPGLKNSLPTVYYFKDLIDTTGFAYLKWAFEKPVEFVTADINARLEEEEPPKEDNSLIYGLIALVIIILILK